MTGGEGRLWSHPDFRRLWLAQTVSRFGSQISAAALPAAAVILLAATPGQMGLLGAAGGAPALLLALFAGAWVDRVRRRPLLIAADLARAALLATVPLAAAFGRLSMAQLYAVAAGAGALTVLFEIADRAFLPSLVPRTRLVEANSRLGAGDSVAEVGGPALGGLLVQSLGAPAAVLVDAVSFLVSAAWIGRIRAAEPAPEKRVAAGGLGGEIRAGLAHVLRDPVLRALACGMGTFSFFGSFIGVLYWVYLVRGLGLSPFVVGLSIGVGGAGALLGAALAEPLGRRFGVGRVLVGSLCAAGLVATSVPLARGPVGWITGVIFAAQLVGDVAIAVFFIHEVSLRQSRIPHVLMGRVNASMELLGRGAGPVGALLAGGLGQWIGIRPTWLIGALGISAASLWLLRSPIRLLRSVESGAGVGPAPGRG